MARGKFYEAFLPKIKEICDLKGKNPHKASIVELRAKALNLGTSRKVAVIAPDNITKVSFLHKTK